MSKGAKLNEIMSQGASKPIHSNFFQRKTLKTVEKIEENEDIFTHKIRDRRLQMLKSLSVKVQAEKNGAAAAVLNKKSSRSDHDELKEVIAYTQQKRVGLFKPTQRLLP